jgi:hypothetical protein
MQIRVGACAGNISTITPVLTASNSLGAMAQTKFAASAEFHKFMSGFPEREDASVPLREASAIECAFNEITPFNMALARGIDPTASVAASCTENVALNSTAGTVDSTKTIAVLDATPTDWAIITEEYHVVFSGAAAGVIVGKNSGVVHSFSALDAAMAPVDGDTKKLFSIPASYFTGTWADGDSYTFYTHAGGSTTYSDANVGVIGLGGLVTPANIRVEAVYTFLTGLHKMTIIYPRAQAVSSLEFEMSKDDENSVPITLESKTADSTNSAGNAAWDDMPLGRIIFAAV